MNTLLVLKHGLLLTFDGFRQRGFISRFLKPLVKKHSERLGYDLTASEKRKVLFYYPMYTVLACAQMYASLKGRALTRDERKRLTLVGAMATLCDDLIDEDNWTRNQIFMLLSENIKEEGLSKKAQLLLGLNRELKSFWPLTNKYVHQLKTALQWQAASGKQSDANISLQEIVHICREKNGHTSLMFATLLDENWTKKELAFIYQSAIVGQLTNDSFDMYFDTLSGIHTYFNTADSIKMVRQFFLSECRLLHSLVRDCSAPDRFKKNTIRRMSVLHAFTLTALDHLQQTEDKHGGPPTDWSKVERKDVITDMAKNSNRFKTIGYMKWLAEQ